jgi:hypothetical protein
MDRKDFFEKGVPGHDGESLFSCQEKDRLGAIGLGMSLQDFLERKALLLRQVAELNKASRKRTGDGHGG